MVLYLKQMYVLTTKIYVCTSSDIGQFVLRDIDQGEYLLIVTHTSNKTYKTPIKLDEFDKVLNSYKYDHTNNTDSNLL